MFVAVKNKFLNVKSVPGIGIICAVLSAIFFSMQALCIRLSTEIHSLQVLGFRYVSSHVSIICITYSSLRGNPFTQQFCDSTRFLLAYNHLQETFYFWSG